LFLQTNLKKMNLYLCHLKCLNMVLVIDVGNTMIKAKF
jgi:hypothetical protein